MGLVVTYFSPATPGVASWDEDISGAVRLGTVVGLVDEAEVGAVGISSLLFDDPDGTLGHLADGLTGLKQLHIDETDCPVGDQRLWTGYIADRRYHRGTDSLVTGVARKIDATITDVNAFLSFRLFAPVAIDATSSFVRPAETDIERVQGLLTDVDFLTTTLFDDGLVSTGTGVAMDACDYTGQHPVDVLNDCAQASGRNCFAQYNEVTGHYQLFYDFDYSPVYDSALRISNVLADVDGITTFAPEPDAELVRDPSRVVSAVYLPFNGSNSPAYRTRPANASNYAWRDATAPSSNVKTLTLANERADRYLKDAVPEDDRITCTVKLPSSKVTGIKAGQRVMAKFSHLPNGSNSTWGSAFQWCRVLNRNVMANEQTNVLYNVRYELSPITSPSCSYVGAPYGGETSLDVFGGAMSYLDFYNPASSIYPSTQATAGWSGKTCYGTPNDGGTFGLSAGVYGAPIAFDYSCTFDLRPIGSPAMCTLRVSVQSGWTLAGNTLELQGSNDGTTWTTVLPTSVVNVGARPSGVLLPISPPIAYDFWRIYGTLNDTRTGAEYFDGLDIREIMLWAVA